MERRYISLRLKLLFSPLRCVDWDGHEVGKEKHKDRTENEGQSDRSWRLSTVDTRGYREKGMTSMSTEKCISAGNGQLIIGETGVGYRDSNYSVMVPWHCICAKASSSVTEDGFLRIGLSSAEPGMGFVVDRVKYSTDDLYEECPVFIDGATFVVTISMGEDLEGAAHLIAERRREYADAIEWMFRAGTSSRGGAVTAINFRAQTVVVDTRCLLQYPPFCPINGDVATRAMPCTSDDGRATLPLVVSESALVRLRRIPRICLISAIGALFVYLALGSWMIFFGETMQQSAWSSAYSFLPVFGVIPCTYWMTRPRIHVTRLTDVRIRVQFDDTEYFQAFVALNGISQVSEA
ncbi:hypothetical protein SCG7086_CS_00050 [Chlamydiales bacterium SCGC AG-110-P3]|nr:hypothetical protein SCG7086_CS_00050 [Chlamydiales bacterium SCGC AG-110-P3]